MIFGLIFMFLVGLASVENFGIKIRGFDKVMITFRALFVALTFYLAYIGAYYMGERTCNLYYNSNDRIVKEMPSEYGLYILYSFITIFSEVTIFTMAHIFSYEIHLITFLAITIFMFQKFGILATFKIYVEKIRFFIIEIIGGYILGKTLDQIVDIILYFDQEEQMTSQDKENLIVCIQKFLAAEKKTFRHLLFAEKKECSICIAEFANDDQVI